MTSPRSRLEPTAARPGGRRHRRAVTASEERSPALRPARRVGGDGGDRLRRADRTRQSIEEAGGRVHVHVVDVTDPSAVERMAADVLDRHGRVDVLVNNVATTAPGAISKHRRPNRGTTCTREPLPCLRRHPRLPRVDEARGRGTIVNIHSVEGFGGDPGDPVYAAMKAAVAHFTTSLAVSVGRDGIRVNGIGPDLTQSPQVDYLSGFEDHEQLWSSWPRWVGSVGPRSGPGRALPGLRPVGVVTATTCRSTEAPRQAGAGSTHRPPDASSIDRRRSDRGRRARPSLVWSYPSDPHR